MKTLLLDASSPMRPRATRRSSLGFEAQTWQTVWPRFWGQNRQTQPESRIYQASPMTSTHVTTCPWLLDHPVLAPLLNSVNRCLDFVNIIYAVSACTLACRHHQVLAVHDLFTDPQSKPICPSSIALSPSARTHLTFSIAVNHLNAQHMHITRQETCCTTLTHAMVSGCLDPHH